MINKKTFRVGLLLLIVGLLALGTAFASTCSGPLVDPVRFSGNPPTTGTRINDPVSGFVNVVFDEVTYRVNYEVYNGGKSLKFWEENGYSVVAKVTVKGGPDANIYNYLADPPIGLGMPVASDCGLQSPERRGNIPNISHIDFEFAPPPYGCLKITKVWEDYPDGFDNFPPFINVNVTGTNDYTNTVTLTAVDDWSTIICDLLPGDYTIEEVEVPGWTPSYNPASRTAAVVPGPEANAVEIVITNWLDKGCLKIIKTWSGYPIGYDNFPDYIDVVVNGPYNYNNTVTLTAVGGWETTICELAPGAYSIEEVELDDWEATYNPESRTQTVVAGTAADAVEIRINNALRKGCLKIVKTWSGYPAGYDNVPDYIDVVVNGPYNYNNTVTLTAVGGWETTICELVPGAYTIEEVELDDWEATYNPESRTQTVVAGTAADAVEIRINNYLKKGCLKIIKDWAGTPEGFDNYPEYVEVIVTGPYNYNSTLRLSAEGNWMDTICELVPGVYQFLEVVVPGWTPSYDPANRQLIVVVGDAPAEGAIGTITNTYVPPVVETSWAAHDVGVYLYNHRWFTYVNTAEVLEDGKANIYAGQTNYAGFVTFTEADGQITMVFTLEDWAFAPGMTNFYVQGYGEPPSDINPSPGQFEFKSTESGTTATITVPKAKYYGIHLNVYEQ